MRTDRGKVTASALFYALPQRMQNKLEYSTAIPTACRNVTIAAATQSTSLGLEGESVSSC